MKKIEEAQKYVQVVLKKDPLVKSTGNSYNSMLSKNLKKFIYVSSLAGIALCFSGCIGGYVATEPIYVEGARPVRPMTTSIWIDGDWIFNRQTHSYARQQGHWNNPRQGRVYVTGSWQVTSKGRHWNPGRWQRQRN